MGLLFLNSINMMISFFLVGNIEKNLMVLHKLSEMDILKKTQIKRLSTLSSSCRQPMVRLSLEKL